MRCDEKILKSKWKELKGENFMKKYSPMKIALKKNKKKLYFFSLGIILLLLISVVGCSGNVVDKTLKSDNVVETMEFSDYPNVLVKFYPNFDTDNLSFYQDGEVVKDVYKNGNLKYDIILNRDLEIGDTTVIEIKKDDEQIFTNNYKIKEIAEAEDNVSIFQRKSDYSEYPIVKHYFEVNNIDGDPIINSININDFTFFEIGENSNTLLDKVKVSKVSEGAKSSIELVADVSSSIEYSGLKDTKESLSTFLDVVDFDNYDEVELISFSDDYYEQQRFTNNKDRLVKAVNNLDIGGMTKLYDTLLHALDRTVIQRGSKMIIATTDGQDNVSYSTYLDVIVSAKKFEIPIYIVGVGTDINVTELTTIAEETGGKFVQVSDFSDLKDYFTSIYKIEKTGLVIEYDVNDLDDAKANILVKLLDEEFVGSEEFKYDPVFVSWGGNNRVDDVTTPYDEREFDSNYYDDSHSYEVVFEDVTWLEANYQAEAKGGYLARITSEEEFDVIIEAIKNATTSQAYLYWLGGSRENSVDGKYTWVDSQLNVMSETLPENIWLPGEPTYYAIDENGNQLFEEKYLNMFYVERYDKWVLNDVTEDLINGYGNMYEGKIAYVIEYEN